MGLDLEPPRNRLKEIIKGAGRDIIVNVGGGIGVLGNAWMMYVGFEKGALDPINVVGTAFGLAMFAFYIVDNIEEVDDIKMK